MHPIFIIEHLEPKLWKWSSIEYQHISKLVGKKYCWFTKLRSKALKKFGKVIPQSVTALSLQNVCVLDPAAPKLLTPEDANQFSYFIFGGILGNDPPQARTAPELTQKFPHPVATRNIGSAQMSTDNAVAVVQEIIRGKKFKYLIFQDGIEVPLRPGESIDFPFRYLLKKGKPLISQELVTYLQRKRSL